MIGLTAFVAFVATIPAANWLIGNVGAVCIPGGPCLIPVAPGLMAPSGVVLIGVALVLRDAVQRALGALWSLGAIAVGTLVSAAVAPAAVVVASTAAFVLSEVADLLVYTALQKRRLVAALLASGVVGGLVDSAVFLALAFGSLDYLPGQFVGKLWALAFVVPTIVFLRRAFREG